LETLSSRKGRWMDGWMDGSWVYIGLVEKNDGDEPLSLCVVGTVMEQ
jgi:hypothetical protein